MKNIPVYVRDGVLDTRALRDDLEDILGQVRDIDHDIERSLGVVLLRLNQRLRDDESMG